MEEEPTTPTAKKSKAKPTRRQSLEGKRTEDDPKSTDAPSDQLTENESGGQNTEGEHEVLHLIAYVCSRTSSCAFRRE